jgi:steroid delta-isomerase-like uncharacterized protein
MFGEKSEEANIAAQELMAKGINSGKLEVIYDVFDPNVVDHDPAPDQGPGPEGFMQFFTMLRRAFPDLSVKPDHMVTDRDNVAIAYTITGTHRDDFLGVAPTGKHITARGMQIARFEKGKIVERWGSSDELGILRQLGAAPQAERPTAQGAVR